MTPVERDPGDTARFVIHDHYATRHHFDLRLEGDGTLWSWAVPRGMPVDPKRNRLAVRVADHALEHIDFEDHTPVEGVEGAMVKSIADHGTYTTVRSSPGKLVFDLDGTQARARYALVHTDGDNWILHLMT